MGYLNVRRDNKEVYDLEKGCFVPYIKYPEFDLSEFYGNFGGQPFGVRNADTFRGLVEFYYGDGASCVVDIEYIHIHAVAVNCRYLVQSGAFPKSPGSVYYAKHKWLLFGFTPHGYRVTLGGMELEGKYCIMFLGALGVLMTCATFLPVCLCMLEGKHSFTVDCRVIQPLYGCAELAKFMLLHSNDSNWRL